MTIKAIETKTYEIDLTNESYNNAVEFASGMIQQGTAEPKTHSIEYVQDFHQIPNDLAEKILNSVIDYVCEQEQKKEPSINKLIDMGFPAEALVDYFGFNLHDVADAIGED